jgi:hypothetical protein
MHDQIKFIFLAIASAMHLPAMAKDLELLVSHKSVVRGADGIKRTIEFSEKIIRTNDQVWIERVLPVATHEHAKSAKESHAQKTLDVESAVRWISRTDNGEVQMRLVPPNTKVLVNVGKVDYSNIGFDGSWTTAWNLLDPQTLKKMSLDSTRSTVKNYSQSNGSRTIKIAWNTTINIPEKITMADGSSERETKVQVISQRPTLPWTQVAKYAQKDYSDFLD